MGWPIGWSLCLHALVLGALSGIPIVEESGVPPGEPLRASLRAHPEAVVVAAAPAPSPVRPSRSVPKVAAPDAVLPAPTFSEPARQDLVERSAMGGAPPTQVASEPVTVALARSEQRGPDAAGLRQYRLALAGEARRFRSYPEAARREGMAGTAEVRVSVTAGTQRQAELARSSGYAVLDTAALEMLRAAAARALLPDSLRGQEFAVLLPVVFEVEE